jgi:hypothetical protein
VTPSAPTGSGRVVELARESEEMMTTIYIVTEGSYSSKRNVAVFSNLKDAERYRDILNPGSPYDDADIEEFELDTIPESYLNRTHMLWYVHFKEHSADIEFIRLEDYNPDRYTHEQGLDHHGAFIVEVWAGSEEAAAKIAMERRSVFLANPTEDN